MGACSQKTGLGRISIGRTPYKPGDAASGCVFGLHGGTVSPRRKDGTVPAVGACSQKTGLGRISIGRTPYKPGDAASGCVFGLHGGTVSPGGKTEQDRLWELAHKRRDWAAELNSGIKNQLPSPHSDRYLAALPDLSGKKRVCQRVLHLGLNSSL